MDGGLLLPLCRNIRHVLRPIVQYGWIDIETPGPHECTELPVQTNLPEAFYITKPPPEGAV